MKAPLLLTILALQSPVLAEAATVEPQSQRTDIQPTDWADESVQSLMVRYRCPAGDPNRILRGNRALSRDEFAVELNACLDRISSLGNAVTADDLVLLNRLQTEFAIELARLHQKIDTLTTKTTKLEQTQVSATTKLSGDALFQIADVFGRDVDSPKGTLRERRNNTVFQSRVGLISDTSFTGRDRLRIRLQSGNFQPFAQPGREVNFGYSLNTNDSLRLGVLNYQFPVGDKLLVALYGNGDTFEELTLFNPINPFDPAAGRGAISRFGYLPPIYRTANAGAGIGANWNFDRNVSLAFGYLAGDPANPSAGSGLFNGNYGAIGRILAKDSLPNVDLTLVYVHSYTGATPTTSGISFLTGSQTAAVAVGRPLVTNSYGAAANWRLSPGMQLGGWAGVSKVRALELGDAEVWNYAIALAFPDLGGRGNLAGLIVGMEPRLTSATPALGTALGRSSDPAVGLHLEAFYRIAVNDNMDITPGVVWLTAPNHDSSNAPIVLGVLRSTFRF